MNVLLLHPEMLFYKTRIFNLLSEELNKRGHILYVWCNSIQKGEMVCFRLINKPFSANNLICVLCENKVNVVINTLFGFSIMPFYLFAVAFLKIKGICHIYYGHGLDLKSLDKSWKVALRNFLHLFFDKLLLYRHEQTAYLWKTHHKKVYIANNSMVLEGFDYVDSNGRVALKRKYGIKHNKIVLFSGRIQPRKRIDILIDFFSSNITQMANAALVIVGPGMDEATHGRLSGKDNIYYLGEIYDKTIMQDVFSLSDIFCIPGLIGLGLVEAMYWGKPVLTIQSDSHGPEIGYLHDGFNGYLTATQQELNERLKRLLQDDDLLKQFSDGARQTYVKEASMEKMLEGFFKVLESVKHKHPDICKS